MSQPNILFVFSDQQHWQAAGTVDSVFRTPNLDRLASQSVTFENAFCTCPQCSPSRSSLLTGRYPSRTGVLGNVGASGGEPLRMKTIACALRDAGYRTAYFGKWHLGKVTEATAGWDEDLGVTGSEVHDDPEVTRRALDFLARQEPAEQPFALFLSYNNPHDVYEYPGTLPADAPVPPLPVSWAQQDFDSVPSIHRQFMVEDQGKILLDSDRGYWERYRQLYASKVAAYDNHLGQVLHALDAQGLTGSTLTMVTSDHGDMDTHHRLIFKGPFMYEHMMRVPLIIRLPGETATHRGRTSSILTTNVDLAPTLLDYAGARSAPTDGVSLKSELESPGSLTEREFVIGQYYGKQRWVNPIRMIRTRRYKYNLYRGHGEELYDLEQDPDELRNLAGEQQYQTIRRDLHQRLVHWIDENADPFFSQTPTDRSGARLVGVTQSP